MLRNAEAAKNSGMAGARSGARSGTAVIRICLAALFAALIASGAYIAIPLPVTPVPVSVQSLFALLAGLSLGPVYGAGAVALYLFAGAIGAPVFAGAAGGFVRFLSPSGGYLWGYLLCAITAGFIAGVPKATGTPKPVVETAKSGGRWGRRVRTSGRVILAAAAGTIAVYLPGLLWLKHVSAGTWPETLGWGLLPFITGDLIKLGIAVLIAPRLRRAVIRVLGTR